MSLGTSLVPGDWSFLVSVFICIILKVDMGDRDRSLPNSSIVGWETEFITPGISLQPWFHHPLKCAHIPQGRYFSYNLYSYPLSFKFWGFYLNPDLREICPESSKCAEVYKYSLPDSDTQWVLSKLSVECLTNGKCISNPLMISAGAGIGDFGGQTGGKCFRTIWGNFLNELHSSHPQILTSSCYCPVP